jgi:putative transposase
LLGVPRRQRVQFALPGSARLQWLNSCYAQWFNWRHGHKGHAFFRRFHSVLIKTDSQLAEDWRWSSYRALIGKEPTPAFLGTD